MEAKLESIDGLESRPKREVEPAYAHSQKDGRPAMSIDPKQETKRERDIEADANGVVGKLSYLVRLLRISKSIVRYSKGRYENIQPVCILRECRVESCDDIATE